LTQGEKMLPPIISHERFHYHLGTGLNLRMPQLRQTAGLRSPATMASRIASPLRPVMSLGPW